MGSAAMIAQGELVGKVYDEYSRKAAFIISFSIGALYLICLVILHIQSKS